MIEYKARYRFGYAELGPVVADYLARLHAHVLTFEQEYGAKVLFVSRAGIRIRRALDAYVQATGVPAPKSAEFFWISRLMVAKGVWNRSKDATIDLLAREFRDASLADFVRAMFRFSPRGAKLRPLDPGIDAPGTELRGFLNGDSKSAEAVRKFFDHQAMLFEGYVEHLVGPSGAALLVDTGWQGTAQTMLAQAFPEYDWSGAYFGRFGFAGTDRREWSKMVGLVFESDTFDPRRPETSVVLNRHLFESLFEPAGRSVEWLAQTDLGQVMAPDARAILADAPKPETDPLYSGVLAYLSELPRGSRLADIRKASTAAWLRLAQMMVHPSTDQLQLMEGIGRSADFGRELNVPILLPVAPRFADDKPDLRIRDSLWPCGQAAMEYPADVAKALQKKLAGGAPVDPLRARTVDVSVRNKPAVAVITRTMDRPMFLERALQSVARQTFRDYVHVVINDGGDNDVVSDTIRRANCDHARIRLVDAVRNRGMEAASNLAIQNSESDYIVIHDDDDSWEPEFLQKTTAFLDGPQGALYGGVISRSTYLSEEVTPAGIVVHDRSPYHGWIENVHIMEMAIGNFFPPIAFLFRRDLWEKLGGYNEQYPVLGDWDFNLRFLVESDIGVVREPLANYHHRDRGDVTLFGNSVIAGREKHLEFAAIVRNNFVRNLVHRGHAAAAALAGMGLYLADQRNTLRATDQRIAQIQHETSNLHLRMGQSGASVWTDHYWIAFQALLKGIAENNPAVMNRIPGTVAAEGASAAGMFARVKQAWPARSKEAPAPAALDRAALELLREAIDMSPVAFNELLIAPDFDEPVYLKQNPDVETAVKKGSFSSGYEHYLRYGRAEGRLRPRRQ